MNKDKLSFGRYLMARRLEQGISLEDVSKATRIGIDTLLIIESEDHARLPADVFVKGFLRSYAKVVGANGDKAVQKYLTSIESFRLLLKPENNLKHVNSKYWLRFILGLSVLLSVIIITFIFFL